MTPKRCVLAVLLVIALAALPALAPAAVVRTVCASGCDFTSVEAAVTASDSGDEIEVMPGTYDEAVSVPRQLIIFGAPGGSRPVIRSAACCSTLTITATGAGTTVSHLDIRGTGTSPPTYALTALGPVTAFDLALTATGGCATLGGSAPSRLGPRVTAKSSGNTPCVQAGGQVADVVTGVTINAPDSYGVVLQSGATLTDSTVTAKRGLYMAGGIVRRATLNGTAVGLEVARTPATVTDSVITSHGGSARAVLARQGLVGGPVVLRNVTAVATGTGSIGLDAADQGATGTSAGSIDARNVIARGTAKDVWGEPTGLIGCIGPCAPGAVTMGYSNFVSTFGFVDTTTVGHNQSADPMLVHPVPGALQDFHIASATSPVIGAGTADSYDGASDRDGVPHPARPSIGAYEYTG